jgi:hypothetical protein
MIALSMKTLPFQHRPEPTSRTIRAQGVVPPAVHVFKARLGGDGLGGLEPAFEMRPIPERI